MKTIAVDMDGVLADVYQQFIKMHLQETGEVLKSENLLGLTEAEAFPHLLKHVNTEGFFRTAPLYDGARETLEQLHREGCTDILCVRGVKGSSEIRSILI